MRPNSQGLQGSLVHSTLQPTSSLRAPLLVLLLVTTEEGQAGLCGKTYMTVTKDFLRVQCSPNSHPDPWTLTFLHHADIHTALEPAGLAVASVVLGDAAVPIEGTGEQRLSLHAPPAKRAHALC
jgi:hypothetical protein